LRALVVHDREAVLTEISELVQTQLGARCIVDRAKDLVGARELLARYHYDLAVIDLTIPAVTGMEDARLEHADWLLNQAFAGALKTPADVIAISLDKDAVQGIRNQIGEHVLAVILEDPDDLWRRQLADKVAYTKNTRRSRLLAANNTFDLDVAIITALDKEMQPYETLLELSACSEMPGTREFIINGRDGTVRRGIVMSAGASGQAPSAAMTQGVLTQFRPRALVMTGFCGGVEGKLDLGDVAVFSSAHPWDYGKWIEIKTSEGETTPKFLPRGVAVSIQVGEFGRVLRDLLVKEPSFSQEFVDTIKGLSNGRITTPKLRSVDAGSGSSVVTSANMLGRIVDVNDGIHAVDMESFGVYHACRNTPALTPDFLCIKAVADFCNGQKNDEFHAACSMASALLAVEILRKHYDFAAVG
jgi:nucleoside phosphorylase/CheY-like chemotaxis protein